MKSIGKFRILQPVSSFFDLSDLFDADETVDMRQRAVVRGYNILIGHRLGYDRFPIGTHARVHNGYENGSFRPVGNSLMQTVGCIEDVVLRDVVGQMTDIQILGYAVRYTFHGADRGIIQSEISLKHDNFIHIETPPCIPDRSLDCSPYINCLQLRPWPFCSVHYYRS